MAERDICERLDEKAREPLEPTMQRWDDIRRQVETMPGASLPRDSFEGLVEWLVEDCAEAAATIRALREALREIRDGIDAEYRPGTFAVNFPKADNLLMGGKP